MAGLISTTFAIVWLHSRNPKNINTGIISFILTSGLLLVFIPSLKRLKFGQSIREDGPESHMTKSGTPTMGGLMIVISIIVTLFIINLVYSDMSLNVEFWLLTLVLVGFGSYLDPETHALQGAAITIHLTVLFKNFDIPLGKP